MKLQGEELRNIPGSATVPVAVSGVSPETFPSELRGEVALFSTPARLLAISFCNMDLICLNEER
jgi:hypothetical protein